jgi:hypothetical protein
LVCHWFSDPLPEGRITVAVRINANSMSLEINNRVVATARLIEHAAANNNGP